MTQKKIVVACLLGVAIAASPLIVVSLQQAKLPPASEVVARKINNSADFLDQRVVVVIRQDGLKWKKLGEGFEVAVVSGDPSSTEQVTIRVRIEAGSSSPRHSLPDFRHLTVLEGTYWLGTGKEKNLANMVPIYAGDSVDFKNGTGMHFDGAKLVNCVIEITGPGPFPGITK